MKISIETAKRIIDENGGSLDLSGTGITVLPDNLTVGGWLNLSGTGITALPDNLTVGRGLNLRGTGITALPDNLTVGGWLDLSGTGITALPDNLTVGGSLDLSGTGITALPDNLTVGGWLNLSGTGITESEIEKVNQLHNSDYRPGHWIYADNILSHIKKEKHLKQYTFYVGRIPGRNVIFDGANYAHCATLREGISDLLFKSASDRGADQYSGLPLDTEMGVEEAVAMYRIITGACKQGSEQFVNSLGNKLKERYTIREMLELTRGQYGSENFAKFFEV